MRRAFCYHLYKRSHNLSPYCLVHLIFVSEKKKIYYAICANGSNNPAEENDANRNKKNPFVFCDSQINSFNAGSELVLSDGRRLTLTARGCLWWNHGSENLFHQAARESSQKHLWPFSQQHNKNNVLWTAMESKAKEAVDVSEDGFRQLQSSKSH